MLKFFRQIRKKLIEQDNVRKYLLYAVGEILLVVIGILIAVHPYPIKKLDKTQTSRLTFLKLNFALMKSTAIILFFYLIFMTNPLFSQPGYSEDVQSIDAIINAYYDVISGSSDQPWQFERDKFLHAPNAQIYRLSDNGLDAAHSLEAEYIPFLLAEREDFYEIEVNRVTHRYGNMAQVFSTYEVRTDPKIETGILGINSIQLYYAEGRWWIANWMTQMESDEPIPAKYLNK